MKIYKILLLTIFFIQKINCSKFITFYNDTKFKIEYYLPCMDGYYGITISEDMVFSVPLSHIFDYDLNGKKRSLKISYDRILFKIDNKQYEFSFDANASNSAISLNKLILNSKR